MTALDTLSTNEHNNNKMQTITVERSDDQFRDAAASGAGAMPCGFGWCEMDMIQDAVCGNGLQLMESRDDDQNDAESTKESVAGSTAFIDDTLKNFSQEMAMAPTMSMSNKTGGAGLNRVDNNNPAMVPKQHGVKPLGTAISTSSSGRTIEKTRYEQFMTLVDSTSKTHGAQSIQVADLYVKMGNDCRVDRVNAKSKELALLLFEEAFSIYQAKSGDSNEKTISCRVDLGRTCHGLGRYDEALDAFCMSVYMREALRGELHPSVSEIWVLISAVHQSKSKLELALKASAKALTGYRNAHGDKHPAVIGVLRTIAQIHTQMGNDDKALDIQKYVRLHSPKDSRGEI